MKCLEKGPYRSVDNAVALTLHHTPQRLDSGRMYVRMVLLDYSSAFDPIQTGKVIVKLTELCVPDTVHAV